MKPILLTLLAGGIALQAGAQGSLTPAGTPGPLMKTLSQLEPRTAITNLPFTITQPGSYYMAASLTTTGHGIVVRADRVDLDLMGFSLSGDRGNSDYGIWLDGASNAPLRNLVIRNGAVDQFGDGVRAEYVQESRFEDLLISSNRSNGIHLEAPSGSCNGNRIANCSISDSGSYGLYLVGGPSGACNGNSFIGCTIGGAFQGIWLYAGESGRCNGNVIRSCTIRDTSMQGILFSGGSAGQCNGNTVAESIISDTGDAGIGMDGSLGGQCEGNTITRCVLLNNKDFGISLTAALNNRIEDNHITGTSGTGTWAIQTTSCGGNLAARNSCVGPTEGYGVAAPDAYGPIVTNTGVLETSGITAHPWANFAR